MAAITSTILALGGTALSAGQAISAQKKKQKAAKAAQVAMNKLSSTKEINKTSTLKSPDISSLAYEANQRGLNQATQAAKEMGVAGAASLTGITEANRAANLGAAQAQSQQDYERDKFVAMQEQGVEARNVDAQRRVLASEITGAQNAVADAEAQKQAGINGMVSSIASGVTAVGNQLLDKEILSLYDKSDAAKSIGLTKEAFAEGRGFFKSKGYSDDDFEKILSENADGLKALNSVDWSKYFMKSR